MKTWKKLAIAVSILSACGAPTDNEDDPRDESVSISTDGKSDAFGYAEGSAQAVGILKVANQTILADFKSKVGITTQAAKGIVAARPLATLTALDAVPYVGKTTFAKLFAYAKAQGDVGGGTGATDGGVGGADGGTGVADPFDPATCSGAPMTIGEARAHFGQGSSRANLGFVHTLSRNRKCNVQTGCNDWVVTFNDYATSDVMYLATDATGINLMWDWGNNSTELECRIDGSCNTTNDVVLTDHCWQSHGEDHTKSTPDSNGNYVETDGFDRVMFASVACTPTTCAQKSANCGSIADECGGTLNCGSCTGSDSCGGGGTANVCGHYISLPCGGACGPNQVCCYEPIEGHDDCFDACG